MADLAVVVTNLSQVRSAHFGHLPAAGAHWRALAKTLSAGFCQIRSETPAPGGSIWRGAAAQAATQRAGRDVATIGASCEHLISAADIAERGRHQLEACQQGVLDAVDSANREGFVVHDDYSVTDTRDCYTQAELDQRQAAATGHAGFIGHRVMNLVAADRQIATALNEETKNLDTVDFGNEPDNTVQLAGWGIPPLSPAPKLPPDKSAFEDLLRANDEAVLAAMAKVEAAKKALKEATSKAYVHGGGSDEAHEAMTRLPALKKNLADALDELGKIPDYSKIDPASVQLGPDGELSFAYTLEGQKMVVTGKLKNGTGEIYDQGAGGGSAYFTYKDGKLATSRFLDPGRVTPDDALLQNVIFNAVGVGPTVTAGKAGLEAGWQGMRSLFAREALEAGGGTATGLTADNVLPRAVAQAEIRAQAAADDLALHQTGTHPPVTTSGDHVPPPTPHEPIPHAPVHVPVRPEPPPLPPDAPEFNGYHRIDPGPEFTDAAGHLIYPNDLLPSKPYAIPGTVIPEAQLPPGTRLGRFGGEAGGYLAPEGTPFAQLSLPPASASKPYLRLVVNDPTALPPGWRIEQSVTAPWFHQPGGGTQFRIIDKDGNTGDVRELIRTGFLKREY
ncbi:TNT domain-containing protein [Mycolicibacter minnesotensis]